MEIFLIFLSYTKLAMAELKRLGGTDFFVPAYSRRLSWGQYSPRWALEDAIHGQKGGINA